MKAFYGSRISPNMTRTPEGFLICHNVPIGRTGWMEYLGEEVPEGPPGQIVKVYRSPEELFSKATMASFEGKSVTNNHPTQNLDLNTVGILERGHVTNVRQDGDFLIADLIVKDQGLIAEIDNDKREVSCGYDCMWVPLNEDHTEYEQKEIIGNHVAVVQNGRAGPRVAIMDQKPLQKERGKKKMPKVNLKFLAGLGFKHFAQDAEPEQIAEAAKAMDELEEGEGTPPAGGENPPAESEGKQILAAIGKLGEAVNNLNERVGKLEQGGKPQVEGADAEFAGLEKDMTTQDEDSTEEGESETVEPDDKKEDKEPAAAADSFDKFYQGMKKTIMSIPDKAVRDKAAKEFVASVRDAMPKGNGKNGYGTILNVVNSNKQHAMDQQQHRTKSMEELNQEACDNWNKQNAHYKGGNV